MQTSYKDGNVGRLMEMGFSLDDSTRALQKCRGDPETAIDMLIRGSSIQDQKQPLRSDRAPSARKERGGGVFIASRTHADDSFLSQSFILSRLCC